MVRLTWLKKIWCANMHTQAMWPMHGKYVCSRCLCEHAVAWEAPKPRNTYTAPTVVAISEAPCYAGQPYAGPPYVGQQASASRV